MYNNTVFDPGLTLKTYKNSDVAYLDTPAVSNLRSTYA
jgi:hypothetical protein